jgi:dephospho-CoA kinase
MRFRVGLTGGIGSGKSLVCSILEKLGVPVYSADREARRLMNTDTGLRESIVKIFGERAYDKEGLNRAFLSETVFGDSVMLSMLNELVHPAVRIDFNRWAAGQNEASYVVEEAAILFESGAFREMDLSVLVYAPEELRISRVMSRDHIEREAVLKRMGHQLSEEQKMKFADHILYNDGAQMLLPQVVRLHNVVLKSIE